LIVLARLERLLHSECEHKLVSFLWKISEKKLSISVRLFGLLLSYFLNIPQTIMNDFIWLIAKKDIIFSELCRILFQLSKKNPPNLVLCFFIKTNKDMCSSIFYGVLVSVSNNETLVDRNFIIDLLEYVNPLLNYQIPST
jgi:hypothetical protein